MAIDSFLLPWVSFLYSESWKQAEHGRNRTKFMTIQCLGNRRIETVDHVNEMLMAWEKSRNERQAGILWQRKKTIDTIPVLSDAIYNILSSFSKSRSLPGGLVKRSKIILLASSGYTNQQIAAEIDLHYNHVATWRNRFLQKLPSLREVEAGSPEKLADKIALTLSDIKRPGAPPEFTQEQIVQIIDLACKSPGEFGYEVSHWSLTLLVAEIKKQGIADRISEKSVSRFF